MTWRVNCIQHEKGAVISLIPLLVSRIIRIPVYQVLVPSTVGTWYYNYQIFRSLPLLPGTGKVITGKQLHLSTADIRLT